MCPFYGNLKQKNSIKGLKGFSHPGSVGPELLDEKHHSVLNKPLSFVFSLSLLVLFFIQSTYFEFAI